MISNELEVGEHTQSYNVQLNQVQLQVSEVCPARTTVRPSAHLCLTVCAPCKEVRYEEDPTKSPQDQPLLLGIKIPKMQSYPCSRGSS